MKMTSATNTVTFRLDKNRIYHQPAGGLMTRFKLLPYTSATANEPVIVEVLHPKPLIEPLYTLRQTRKEDGRYVHYWLQRAVRYDPPKVGANGQLIAGESLHTKDILLAARYTRAGIDALRTQMPGLGIVVKLPKELW